MKRLLQASAVAALVFIFFKLEVRATIPSVSLPYTIDTADTPRVEWVDANDSALRVGLNRVIDTANIYLNNGVVAQVLKSNTNARATIDADANGTGHKFAITNNGSTDTIASFRDDTSSKFFGRVHVVDSILGASARLTGSLRLADSLLGVTARYTGNVRADSFFAAGKEKFGYDDTSFTLTLTGTVASTTGTAYLSQVGKSVTIYIPALIGASNTTAATITGLPARFYPARTQGIDVYGVWDNSTMYRGQLNIATNGVMSLFFFTTATASPSSTFTSSNDKGFNGQTITYSML